MVQTCPKTEECPGQRYGHHSRLTMCEGRQNFAEAFCSFSGMPEAPFILLFRPFPSEAYSRVYSSPAAAVFESSFFLGSDQSTHENTSRGITSKNNAIRRPANDQADSRDVRVDNSILCVCVCALTLSFPIIYTLSFI